MRIVKGETFQDLAGEWMRTRGALKRSKATDETLLRAHLCPAFGAERLETIDVARIERFKAGLGTLKVSSQNRVLTLLRTLLKFAAALGWLPVPPAVKLHRAPRVNRIYRYLRTDEEVRRFLRAAKDIEPLHGQPALFVPTIYAFAIYSGLRLGEICALERDAIDFDRRLITVRASHDGAPKSGDIRHVPILDALLLPLETYLLSVKGALVFPSTRGTRLTRTSKIFRGDHVLRRVLCAAGLPPKYISFHGLRHSFASHWVMKGGDIFKLQSILGHSSIRMTMIYAHLAPHAFDADHARFNTLRPERPAEIVQLPLLGTR